MTRFIIILLAVFCISVQSFAQTPHLNSNNFILVDPGSGNTLTLVPGSLTGNQVLTLPNTTGTLSTGAGFTPAYLNAYSFFNQLIFFNVSFQNISFAVGFTALPGNSGFTVAAAGTYKIDYHIDIPFAQQPGNTLAIFVNGVQSPGTQIDCATIGATSFTTILSLNAGDVISVGPTGFLPVSIGPVFPGSVCASITAVRIQ